MRVLGGLPPRRASVAAPCPEAHWDSKARLHVRGAISSTKKLPDPRPVTTGIRNTEPTTMPSPTMMEMAQARITIGRVGGGRRARVSAPVLAEAREPIPAADVARYSDKHDQHQPRRPRPERIRDPPGMAGENNPG